ncbi:hypothetical protein NQ317_011561 [Molorchus minor]|uniref:C2H2-type domain-containing protein n=1 Tax=Molorchus minor TaxID=1323400 RepID=A0ABQ9JRM1_9CUCU|nr:hypothetical protein NQ317_011561 [Molorchus minor]
MVNEWPKQCDYCDKICHTGAALYRHKQVHEKERILADGADVTPTKVPILKSKGTKEGEESYHTCKRCFKVFSSSPSNKKVVKKITCDVCHLTFINNEALAKHISEHHNQEASAVDKEADGLGNKVPFIFTCDVCVMTFTTKIALKKHKEEHAQEAKIGIVQKPVQKNKVYCKYCKISFPSILNLTKHMHTEHDETAKPKTFKEKSRHFGCNICKKVFITASALSTHMGKPAKILKENKLIDKLANSVKIKSEPIEPPQFQCTTCLAELPNDTALQVHILEKHRSVSAIMLIPRCNICNQDFSNQDEYETHKRLHDFLERQKQQGQQMLDIKDIESQSKQSVTKESVKMPIAGQPKFAKGFPCKYCTAAFSRTDTLTAHIRQYHPEFVQTEFKCTQCDRVFDKQNSLSIHLKVHEKQRSSVANVVSTSPKPMFSCSICSMGFQLPKDLRAHTISAHPF